MFDSVLSTVRQWILAALVNQALDAEMRWKMVQAALDFLADQAEKTDTKVDDVLVAFAQAGTCDEEFRELADQIIREWCNANVEGKKLSASSAAEDPTLVAHAKVLAEKMNAFGGRFIDWKTVDWQKVLEIVMAIVTMFAEGNA
jgi:hypothetical protein